MQLYSVGTAAVVKQVSARSNPQPHFTLVLIGVCRFKVEEFTKESPYLVATVTQLDYLSSEGECEFVRFGVCIQLCKCVCVCVCACAYMPVCVATDEETLPLDVKQLAKDLRMAASELVELLDVNSATADRMKVRPRITREHVPTVLGMNHNTAYCIYIFTWS